MRFHYRTFADRFEQKMRRPWVHVLFGARQTGKSTLVRRLLPDDAYIVDLADPGERSRFSAHPEELIRICRALPGRADPWVVFVDEAQLVPDLFNAVQTLYDEDRDKCRFILCGSSARKLRTSGANLLPGRSIHYALYPLITPEYEMAVSPGVPAPAIMAEGSLIPQLRAADNAEPNSFRPSDAFSERPLADRLLFGDLPGIAVLSSEEDRRDVLKSYVSAHLEDEIRRETAIRHWDVFLRFLAFAAQESGGIMNLQAISRESGLSAPTIRSHYQLLEDMFLGFTVPAFSGSPRKAVLSSPRFLFFDLGVRNAAAGLNFSPDIIAANPGPLFEQWVGIELHKRLKYIGEGGLSYFRTSGGAEVDFIVERGGTLAPIEVKWTEHPTPADARHLITFMKDHPDKAERGYVVCRCSAPQALSENVTALPWWAL